MQLHEIDKAMNESYRKARTGYILKYFNNIGITDCEGVPLRDLEYAKLEDLYITAKCDEGRAMVE